MKRFKYSQHAVRRGIKRGISPLAAVEPLRLTEWAEQHFYLSAESSYSEGRWQAFPFQRAVMDAISNDEIKEVIWKKSARVGYTKIILAAMLYFAEHKRRNQAIWQPTDEDMKDFAKTELDSVLRDAPVMEKIFPAFMRRHKDNTMQQKKFMGSILHMRGGKAAKNYRRLSVDCAFLDELDGFDMDIEREGDPVTLAAKRVEGATFPKVVLGSTPKLKGFSMIEAREKAAVLQFTYHIPCPHCGEEHPLRWGSPKDPYGIKWTDNDPTTAAHLCESCSALMTQADYLKCCEQGRWKSAGGEWIDPEGIYRNAEDEIIRPPKSVAFHIWTAYSPMANWPDIVEDFLTAKEKASNGDKSMLKSFVNTTLGESWEEEIEQADQHELAKRAEEFPLRTIPYGGLVLVAGVDVQDNRFEVVLWAFGKGLEMWTIDYQVLSANPADEKDWQKLDQYLQSSFTHESGKELKISATAIDTGGHFTHHVYQYTRSCHASRRVYAIKGDHREGMPVKGRTSAQDVNWRGRIIKSGVKLWMVGTDTAKDLFFGFLKVEKAGPGYVHFSNELPPEFYAMLTAEARVLMRTSTGEKFKWMKRSQRNETIDCTVYALFAAQALDLHRYTKNMWERLENEIQPQTRDLFESPQPDPEPEENKPFSRKTAAQRRKGKNRRERGESWIQRTGGWSS